MKTLNLSDEDYAFLKDCVNELKTQDNRCTRSPLYTIHATQTVYGVDLDYAEDDTYIWDGDNMGDIQAVFTYLTENGYDSDLVKMYNDCNPGEEIENFGEDDELTPEQTSFIRDWFCESHNSYEVEEAMKELTGYTFSKVGISKEDQQVTDGGCFSFFEKDAFDHIAMNGHNIRGENIHTYADSLYRTPRMEQLLELLHKLELKEEE